MRKCPNCGSKNLESEDSVNRDFQIVSCLDCDAVFELHQKGSKRSKFDDDEEEVEQDEWSEDAADTIDYDEDDDDR